MKRILLLLLIIGCSQTGEKSRVPLSENDKVAIEALSTKLALSLNDSDFKYFRSIWSDELFGERVKDSKVNASVYNHFQKEIVNNIRNLNSMLILDLNEHNGEAQHTGIEYFDNYAELSYLFVYPKIKTLSFYRYRVESVNGKLLITDVFDLKNEVWYSDHVIKIMELNAQYDAYSEERKNANIAFRDARYSKQIGDYVGALKYSYEIPDTHWVGNWLSLERLEIASNLDDTTYLSVLETEYEYNKSLYLRYLYTYAFDSAAFEQVIETLQKQTNSPWIDSLAADAYFWK